MGAVKNRTSGNLATVLGYQGTQNIQSPGVAGSNLNPAVKVPGSPIALLAANFDEPSLYTVSFNIAAASVLATPTPSQGPPDPTIVKPVGTSSGVRCLAILQFNLEGVTVRRVIDVGSGTSISQVCQGVNVFLQDMTYTVGGPAGALYSVSAVISKGTRPATSLPPILWQQPVPGPLSFSIPPTSSVLVPVPQDAGVTSVDITVVDITVPATTPTFFNVTHFTNSTPTKFYAPVIEPNFVKVNPGTNFIALSNHSATDTIEATVTYGIDG